MKSNKKHSDHTQINSNRRSGVSLVAFAIALTMGCGSSDTPADKKNDRSETGQTDANPSAKSDGGATAPSTTGDSSSISQSKQGDGLADSSAASHSQPFTPFEPLAMLEADGFDIGAIAIAPDGQTFVTGGGAPKIWSFGNDQPTHVFDTLYEDFSTEAKSIAFTADGNTLLIGSTDGTLSVIDYQSKEVTKQFQPHPRGIVSVAVSRDGSTLTTSGYDGQVKTWNAESFVELATIDTQAEKAVHAALTPDGQTIVSAGDDALVWEARTGNPIGDLNLGAPREIQVMAVDISPDGKYVATGEATADFENAALVWSVETRKLIATLKHELGVWSVAFSPNRELLATASVDAKARIWRIADQELLQTMGDDELNSVDQIAWLPNGQALAVASEGTIRFWGVAGAMPSGETANDASAANEPEEPETPADKDQPDQVMSETEKPVAEQVELPQAATLQDLKQAFDLQAMEKMPDAQVTYDEVHLLRYSAPGSAKDAVAFHAKMFEAAGWKMEDSVDPSDDDTYKTLPVQKEGYFIDCSFQNGNSTSDNDRVYVTIEHHGNVDPRIIPRPAKFKWPGGDRSADSYVAEMESEAFTAFAIKTLTDAGWEHVEGLDFTQNALQLRFQVTSLGDDGLSVSITVNVEQ